MISLQIRIVNKKRILINKRKFQKSIFNVKIQLRYFITKISERSPNEKVVPEHSLFRIVQDRSRSFVIVRDRSWSFVIVRDRSWSFRVFFYIIHFVSIYFCEHSNRYSICMYLFLHIRLRSPLSSHAMTLTFLEIWKKVKKMTLNFFKGLLENTFWRFL